MDSWYFSLSSLPHPPPHHLVDLFFLPFPFWIIFFLPSIHSPTETQTADSRWGRSFTAPVCFLPLSVWFHIKTNLPSCTFNISPLCVTSFIHHNTLVISVVSFADCVQCVCFQIACRRHGMPVHCPPWREECDHGVEMCRDYMSSKVDVFSCCLLHK